MASKNDIISLPNPHLRQQSQRVSVINDDIKQVIADMKAATLDWEASREHEVGVALAAVQIDKLYRIVVIRNNFDDKSDHTFSVFLNPEIVKYEGDLEEDFEGCLSVPDIYGKVPRYERIRMRALDEDGREIKVKAEGFLARVIQHEVDHTKGTVFIDHIEDNPQAFYRLKDDGKLEKLNYEQVRQTNIFR